MKLTRKQIENYFENECAFRDYEFLPVSKFGKVSKARTINLLEPTKQKLEDALDVFVRDGFETIICYVGSAKAAKPKKVKRIKKVFSSSSQVFHLWANQSQQYARQGGRITRAFFEGTTAYSYGRHYIVGEIKTYRGVKVAVINSTKYSNTTSKHTSEAEAACRDLMPVVRSKSLEVFDGLIEEQDALVSGLFNNLNSRRTWYSFDYFFKYELEPLQTFNKKCIQLRHPELVIKLNSDFISLLKEHHDRIKRRELELKSPEAIAKREEQRVRRVEAEKRKRDQYIEDWKNGLKPRNKVVSELRPQLIRISGNEIETSGGARVPLVEAKALLRNILSKTVEPGERIGSFTVTRIQDGIVKIGCHEIELEHAKQVLGNAQFRLINGGNSQ